MAVFERFFKQSNGCPVDYDGQVVNLFDRLQVNDGQEIKVIFESVHSNWRQGIHLSTDGTFEVNKQTAAEIVLWQDTSPREVVLKVHSQKGECLVMNIWDTGNGLLQRGHNGAAMIVEELPNGRRYQCNDGFADDDFDDIVFRLERV
ncbi:MAG: hypothetical protein SFX18_01780 [Pirellulales bacterium]|nr:hypothetical protein [Pirellulales bacterium]